MTLEGPLYRGMPLEEVAIIDVWWSDYATRHIQNRSERYGRHDPSVEPEWATEAATDEFAALGVSPTSGSLVVFGHSPSMPVAASRWPGRLLKVWLEPINLQSGEWEGLSAAVASDKRHMRYWQRRLTT